MPKAKAKTAESESNIHAIVGSDESEVKRAAAELAAKLAPPDAGEFGLEIIDACADNVDQAVSRIRSAIEALQTLPFFGGGKLVWLKNANCLGDSVIGRSASVQSALEDLAELLDAGFGFGRDVADQRDRSRQAPLLLQDAGQTRRTSGDRSARFVPGGLGRRSDGDRAGGAQRRENCSSKRRRSIFSCS